MIGNYVFSLSLSGDVTVLLVPSEVLLYLSTKEFPTLFLNALALEFGGAPVASEAVVASTMNRSR